MDKDMKETFEALYEAVLKISSKSGLSIASITGSINHTHEKRLMEAISKCQQDPKENTSQKYTEH